MKQKRTARIVNRKRKRRVVILINPSDVAEAIEQSDGEAVEQIFEEFRGKPARAITEYEVGPGVPLVMAELGGLLELELVSADPNQDGRVYEFDPDEFRLCADAQGNLRIAGPQEINDEMPPRESVLLGEVVRVDYVADKPHLYPEDGEVEFTHTFGDDYDGASGPDLYYRDGYLSLDPDTGDYEILPEGISDTEPGRERNGFFSSAVSKTVGDRWEVDGYGEPEVIEPDAHEIGTFRARSKQDALKQAREQIRKDGLQGHFVKLVARKL